MAKKPRLGKDNEQDRRDFCVWCLEKLAEGAIFIYSDCYEPGSRYTFSDILLRILRGYALDPIGTFTRTSAYIPESPYCI